MNENTIAIVLYISILLMATTVLVLTIIYFFRPNSARTKTSDGKQNMNAAAAPVQVQLPETVTSSVESEVPVDKSTSTLNPSNEIQPAVEEKIPELELSIKASEELKINETLKYSNLISENQDQKISNEISNAETQPANNLPGPIGEVAAARLDEKNPGLIENELTNIIESGRKESELTMDTKHMKQSIKAETEKTPVTSDAGKVLLGKKAPENKTSLDELSKMFSKEVTEDTEVDKLAKEMKEVEVNNLVKDGLDLIYLLKQRRS